ncbi:MAG: Maf family protein [Suilimivivens sp.]
MTNKKIILASGSPRRRELLTQIGMEFEVRKSDTEENAKAREPSELVKELSGLKAADIWQGLPEDEKKACIVIGADTVVSFAGSIMGKPKDEEDAVSMLSRLQGRTHQVYTGVTLIYEKASQDTAEQKSAEPRMINTVCRKSFFEETDVVMYPMTLEEITAYVATGEPMDKAGAYGIQGKCAAYIKGISGDYNNVVGLPIGRLYQEMKKI